MPALGFEGFALGLFFGDPLGMLGHEAGVRVDGARGNGAVGGQDRFVQAKDFIDFIQDGGALLGRKVAGVVGARGRRGSRSWSGLGVAEVELVLGEVEAALGQVVVETEFDEVGGRGGQGVEAGSRAGDGGVEGLMELARDWGESLVEPLAEAMGLARGWGDGVWFGAGAWSLHRVLHFLN